MKTAIRLNRKELLALYEKSSGSVKESLRAEFGENFFATDKPQAEIRRPKNNSTVEPKRKSRIDWSIVLDYTSILRIVGYACLVWIILMKI